jgi:hypothetical protein
LIAFRERVQGSRTRRSEGERLKAERKARERGKEEERGEAPQGKKLYRAIVHPIDTRADRSGGRIYSVFFE